MARITRRNALR